MYDLRSELALPRPREEIFAFFSDAKNLEILTPAWLHFEILTPEPIELRAKTLLDYRLRLRGIPIRWQSEITVWQPPFRFADEQRKGPYKLWIHEHRFEERGGATIAVDRVQYDHWGGWLVNRFIVARDLEKVFAFRRRKLLEIFGGSDAPNAHLVSEG